jgi:hypothetical protein
VTVPPPLRAMQKVYMALKQEEDPTRPTVALEEHHLKPLLTSVSPHAAVLVQVTYALSQRIGDTSKGRSRNVCVISDPASGLQLVAIQGKTVRTKDPFTLHLPVHSEAGRAVWTPAQERKCEEYLFASRLMLGSAQRSKQWTRVSFVTPERRAPSNGEGTPGCRRRRSSITAAIRQKQCWTDTLRGGTWSLYAARGKDLSNPPTNTDNAPLS